MNKVIAIGEILIDFIPDGKGKPLKDVSTFTKKPGGAPANVAVCVSRLGGKSKFIGKVGADAFGEFLLEVLNDNAVDTTSIIKTKQANTALAFVSLTTDGDRDFSFYRNPSADMLLESSEIKEEDFEQGDVLHFCSVDLIDAPVKQAHKTSIEYAKKNGCTICFDPNVRLPLWEYPEDCKRTILEFIKFADILKISDDELSFITEIQNEKEALEALRNKYQFKGLMIVTKGKDGVTAYKDELVIHVPGYNVEVKDTTGAGDSFVGAFLYQWVYESGKSLEDMLKMSNAVGALTTMKEGAITALPYMEDVKNFIDHL